MTTNTYADVYNWVCPDLPMCPIPIVQNAIRDAVIELCERALLWRQEVQQILVLGPTSTNATNGATAGATTIVVDSITNLNDADTITILLTDGTTWRGHISGAPVGFTVTLDGALNQNVDAGAVVKKLVYLYPITVPTGTAIVKGLNAWLNNNPIDPISQDDLDNEFNNTSFGWVGVNWRTDVNLPSRWYMPDDTTVGLLLAPDAGGTLRINAALKPTRASTTFPAWIFERYVTVIAAGAKARIMSIQKKPYTDLQSAAIHATTFYAGIADARVRMARGNTRAALRTHTVFGLR